MQNLYTWQKANSEQHNHRLVPSGQRSEIRLYILLIYSIYRLKIFEACCNGRRWTGFINNFWYTDDSTLKAINDLKVVVIKVKKQENGIKIEYKNDQTMTIGTVKSLWNDNKDTEVLDGFCFLGLTINSEQAAVNKDAIVLLGRIATTYWKIYLDAKMCL